MRLATAIGLSIALAAGTPAVAAQRLAPGLTFIPGGIEPGHQPDGNSLIFDAPDGLIVFDTGRHSAHSDAVASFARDQRRPVSAIINSHWHLDHVSGNIPLKAEWPAAKVYASDAIEGALHGFLADSARDARAAIASGKLDAATVAEVEHDLATVDHGAQLRPDVVIAQSQTMRIVGRRLDVHLARNAATAGDVWLFDPATRIVAAGDLVTLPAPFLDTACPQGWRDALATVAGTRFRLLVPGHGEPMTPKQFATYRTAFGKFIDCAKSPAKSADCSAGWAADLGDLLPVASRRMADGMTGYYVDMLRANGGRAKSCAAA